MALDDTRNDPAAVAFAGAGTASPTPFSRYIENARNGRNGMVRYSLSLIVIAAVWIIGTLAIMLAAAVYLAGWPFGGVSLFEALGRLDMQAVFVGRAGVALLLVTIGSIWPATYLAVRVFQRRPFAGVLGWNGRFRGGDWLRGIVAVFVAVALTMPLSLYADPSIVRSDIPVGDWLAAFLPLTAAIALQSSAEEVLFRGYMVQTLASRFRSPFIWAIVPCALFTMLHWSGGGTLQMALANLAAIAMLAALLTLLVYRTGGLSAAFGVHLAVNVTAVLFVSSEGVLGTAGLFRGRSPDAPDWTVADAAFIAATGVLLSVVIALLLLHRRSPLRLRSIDA